MIFMSGTNCEMFLINTFFRVQVSVSKSTYLILFTRLFWDAELYFRKEKYFIFWLYMLLYLWTLKYCLQIKFVGHLISREKEYNEGPRVLWVYQDIVEISFSLNFCEFLAYNLSSSSSLRRFMKYREWEKIKVDGIRCRPAEKKVIKLHCLVSFNWKNPKPTIRCLGASINHTYILKPYPYCLSVELHMPVLKQSILQLLTLWPDSLGYHSA